MSFKHRLVDYVNKHSNLKEGIFANINNDIAVSVLTDPPEIFMAYGYVRRSVGAGLFLQGIFDFDEYMYQTNMFKKIQQITAQQMGFTNYQQTVDFQEKALTLATDFMQTYDKRLSKKFVMLMVNLVDAKKTDLVRVANYENVMLALSTTFAEYYLT